MIPTTIVPVNTYPGQAFDELGSLVSVMPDYRAFALNIWSTPASPDAINVLASTIMQSGITPYGE